MVLLLLRLLAGQLLVPPTLIALPPTLIALLILPHLALSGIYAHGRGMRCPCAPLLPPTTHMLSALGSLASAALFLHPFPRIFHGLTADIGARWWRPSSCPPRRLPPRRGY